MGIIDIVKQEAMELEKATNKVIMKDEPISEDNIEGERKAVVDPSLREKM